MKSKSISTISCMLVMFLVVTLAGAVVSADSSDSVFRFGPANPKYVYFTEQRAKENTSGSYVYYVEAQNQPDGTYFSIWSGGVNETTKGAGIIHVGQKRKISQWVYEKGKRVCNLGVSPSGTAIVSNIAGLWSPDSVGNYPYCNLP